MKKLRALRDLNSYTLRDIMKQVGGYQFNIFQVSGQGIILDDEVFLAIPSGEEYRVVKGGQKKLLKTLRYWNVTNFARTMAGYPNTINLIILDCQREKILEPPPGMDEDEMPLDRRHVPKTFAGTCHMIFSVLGGVSRTVEIVPDEPDKPAYSMGTFHFVDYLSDAVFYKTFKF